MPTQILFKRPPPPAKPLSAYGAFRVAKETAIGITPGGEIIWNTVASALQLILLAEADSAFAGRSLR